MKLDEVTLGQAEEYANNEAEARGFKIGSEKWKEAYKEFCGHALASLAVGRNPRGGVKYRTMTKYYPEIFGLNGFAGRVAKNYLRQDGGRGISVADAESRILSSTLNLVKMFENGIAGLKTSTLGNQQGKISTTDMSEFQLPNKEDFQSDDAFKSAVIDVLYNWLARDTIMNVIFESLQPFWDLKKSDIEEVLAAVKLESNVDNVGVVINKAREELTAKLRQRVKQSKPAATYTKWIF